MAHQGATKEFHPEYRIKGESREEKRKKWDGDGMLASLFMSHWIGQLILSPKGKNMKFQLASFCVLSFYVNIIYWLSAALLPQETGNFKGAALRNPLVLN